MARGKHLAKRSVRLPARLLAIGAGLGTLAIFSNLDPLKVEVHGSTSHLAVGALTLGVLIATAVDTLVHLIAEPEGPRAATIARRLLPVHLSLGSAAALFLLAKPVIGFAAYPLLLAPLLATFHAFRQLGQVRRTFDQTITSLARIPEIAGYSHVGHARRVSELARATGKVLRLSDKDVDAVGIAARLHDLGRMQAQQPEEIASLDPSALAAGGASVVRMSGALPGVATIIEHQHDRFIDDNGRLNENLPIGSRIVHVASIFDDLTATGADAHSTEEALAIMDRGRGRRFDPAVLDAFTRVLTARGK